MTNRLLLVHAHPDDESLSCGATMARYAAEGAEVTLVTCTLGEEGEVIPAHLAQLAPDQADQLGGYRIGELDRACAALGVTDHRFLGGPGHFRDSGMMGLATNDAPRAFWSAPFAEPVGLLADVIREVRPQVVVTYDDQGGYGHPDHIQAHRITMAAVEQVAGEWDVPKLYWTAQPVSQQRINVAAEGSPFAAAAEPDQLGFAVPDEEITATIDGSSYVDAKRAALIAHATQVSVDGDFYALSNGLSHALTGVEHYRLVRGKPAAAREDDLFAGL
ncbi:MAG TPA: N-acetyl-1-D-myo-inositol-2-amino-2-deoxy-alpha-D-glucopyranoside deacetylase [Mycobacteriales bacterium]|nr:N-acetyl-1-D-myo-inositol-2-amino-2-deoxy-alpha-D-glucopyranoside deacetylase [Mycobacteriales bacterium]